MGDILLFIIAFSGLLSGLAFLRKDESPMPFFQSILECFLTELCIGTIAAKICSVFSIAVDLKSMGFIYLAVSILIWGYSVKIRQFQKFQVSLWDVYFIVMIAVWFLILFFVVFTPDIKNKYINSDAAAHFALALAVMDSGEISSMHFGELFNGLILSMAEHFLARLSLYKIYILSDAFANLVNVFMFCTIAATFSRHKIVKAFLPFLSFGYFLGWPLWSYILGGFGYLAWGATLFAHIIYLLIRFYNSVGKKEQLFLLITIAVNCLGLAFCYMLFMPLSGMLILITLFYKVKKSNDTVSLKKIGTICMVVLIMGCVIGLICFKSYFHGNLKYFFYVLQMGGWTHNDLYRDFVFLMPAVFYMGWYYIKSHKLNLIFMSEVVIVIFVGFTFILCLYNIISPYYYYKSYYLLWLFSWLMLIDAIEYFINRDKGIVIAYGVAFSIPLFMTISGADNVLEEKGINVNEKHSSFYPSFYPILDGYAYYLSEENNWLEDKEALLDMSGYILSNFSEEKAIPLIACDGRWGYWYYSFTRQDSVYVANSNELLDTLFDYVQAGYDYVVIHQNSETYRKIEEELQKYEKEYDNGYYGLYHILSLYKFSNNYE